MNTQSFFLYDGEKSQSEVSGSAKNSGAGAYEIQYQMVSGNWVSIELQFGSTLVRGKLYNRENPDCTDQVEILPNMSMPVLRSIVLPQTQPRLPRRQFTFSYNFDSTASASDEVRLICGSPVQPYSRTASVGWGSLSQMTMPAGYWPNGLTSKRAASGRNPSPVI